MKLILKVSLLLTIIFSFSCASNKKMTNHPLIVYERTSCGGECPVFIAEFYESGKAFLFVEENFLRGKGTYKVQVSKKTLQQMREEFKNRDFGSFNKEYLGNMKDLPTSYIQLNEAGETKRVKVYGKAPEDVDELKNYLFNIIKNLEWKETSK